MGAETLTPSEALAGDLDVDATCAVIPKHYMVKGMFIASMAEPLRDQWEEVAHRLIAPPRGGRYVAFKDYPQVDHFRLAYESAVRRSPRLGTREAVRRRARDDFEVFSRSTVGKIMLAVVGNARAALMKVPEAYRLVVTGVNVRAEEGARSVTLWFDGYYGAWEYSLGQLEGVVLAYGARPTATVERLASDTLKVHVDLDA